MSKKTLIAMPAYNEAKVIAKVLSDTKKEGYKDILVVDDHSTDNTYNIAKKSGVKVLKHKINRGAGAATATIIEYAKINNYDYLVIMDSDGQHSPKDIKKLLTAAKSKDVVIGSRMINPKGMPLERKIANKIGSIVTGVVLGLFVKDSQSGFKVLNQKAMSKIKITFDGYEFSSEMIGEIKRNNLTYTEVPIKVIYTDHSISKGQTIINGFKMVIKFILKS